MDLRPLHLEDFEAADTSAEIFIESTKLNMVLERIIEFQDRNAGMFPEKVRTALRHPYPVSLSEMNPAN